MSNPITVHCSNGFTLTATGSNIIVSAKRTNETYPISKIQSFALKEPKVLSPGTITFRTAQVASAGIRLGFGISTAIGAEQNFFFQKAELESALALRDYVANYETCKTAQIPAGMVVSVVDEIRGLKSLLDDGVISQEEFEAKKKQLLDI